MNYTAILEIKFIFSGWISLINMKLKEKIAEGKKCGIG